MKIANKNGSIYTTNKEEFNGSNTFAVAYGCNENNGFSVYVVYSYGYHFPMYVFKGGKWYENGDKYSQSTSKQQNQLRPSIQGEFIMKTTDELKALIKL